MNRKYVLRWCAKAESDLKAVNQLLKSEEPPTDVICFLCQQAVEKYLKAFLTSHKVEVKKTHDIEYLLDLCAEKNNDFLDLIEGEKASQLTDFAVEVRYPEEFYIPSLEEAREYFEIASKIRDFVLKKLEIKEEELTENEKKCC